MVERFITGAVMTSIDGYGVSFTVLKVQAPKWVEYLGKLYFDYFFDLMCCAYMYVQRDGLYLNKGSRWNILIKVCLFTS